MHNFIKKLEKKFGGHGVFWGSVVVFIILLLILGFNLSRRDHSEFFTLSTRSMPPIHVMPVTRAMPERDVLRSGSMSLTSANADDSLRSITNIVMRYGGFIEHSNIYDISESTRGVSLSARVPNSYFDSVLGDIKKTATSVETESLSTYDQTETVGDLSTRITNLKAEEKQYRDLLAKATETEDIVLLRQALSNVQEKIEMLQSLSTSLSRQVAMSRISVSLTADKPAAAIDTSWQASRVVRDGFKNLVEDLQSFSKSLILFVLAMPVLIFKLAIFALILIGLWKFILWVEKEFKIKR